ncbi:hypothetical protein ACTHRH_14625 [Paenibacillus sp. SAFN-117]
MTGNICIPFFILNLVCQWGFPDSPLDAVPSTGIRDADIVQHRYFQLGLFIRLFIIEESLEWQKMGNA